MAPNGTTSPRGCLASPNSFRKDIEASLSQIEQVLKASLKPIPPYPYPPTNEPIDATSGILADLRRIGFKDVETLIQVTKESFTGVDDDNKFLLEHVVQLASKLPPSSKNGAALSSAFINQLWNVLPHPPTTSLGAQYRYRTADGSYNNIYMPDLGKADTPYARTTKPELIQNVALPDPGTLFDELMARPADKFEPHPNGISSMLFYLASIIIHDLFRTVRSNKPHLETVVTKTCPRIIPIITTPRHHRTSTSPPCTAVTKMNKIL
jgi:hypothetical protein